MIRTVLPICLILASVPSAVAVPILNDAAHPTNDDCLHKNGRRLLGPSQTVPEEESNWKTAPAIKLRDSVSGETDDETAKRLVFAPHLKELEDVEKSWFEMLIRNYPEGDQVLVRELASIPVDRLEKGKQIVKSYLFGMSEPARDTFWLYLTSGESGCYIPTNPKIQSAPPSIHSSLPGVPSIHPSHPLIAPIYQTCEDLADKLLEFAPPDTEAGCLRKYATNMEKLAADTSKHSESFEKKIAAAETEMDENDKLLAWTATYKLGFDIMGSFSHIPGAGDILDNISAGLNAVNDYRTTNLESINGDLEQKIAGLRDDRINQAIKNNNEELKMMAGQMQLEHKSHLEKENRDVLKLLKGLKIQLKTVEEPIITKYQHYEAILNNRDERGEAKPGCWYCEAYKHYKDAKDKGSSKACSELMAPWADTWLNRVNRQQTAEKMCEHVMNLDSLLRAAQRANTVADTLKKALPYWHEIIAAVKKNTESFDKMTSCGGSLTKTMNIIAGNQLLNPLGKMKLRLEHLKDIMETVYTKANEKVEI